jgi:hypothetical protein
MSRYTAPKITVIILTNLALCRTERLAHTVAGIVDSTLEPYPETTRDSAPKLTATFKSFLDAVSAGSADFSVLSAAARTKLVPSTMNTLQRDLRELGTMNHFSLAEDVSPEHPHQRVYRVEGDDMVEFYTVNYTDDSRIDGLDLFREY